jgi:hypothetical protein
MALPLGPLYLLYIVNKAGGLVYNKVRPSSCFVQLRCPRAAPVH